MIFKISWSIFPGLGDSRVNAQLFLYVHGVGECRQCTEGQGLGRLSWMVGWKCSLLPFIAAAGLLYRATYARVFTYLYLIKVVVFCVFFPLSYSFFKLRES